jgi:hypothetical protein
MCRGMSKDSTCQLVIFPQFRHIGVSFLTRSCGCSEAVAPGAGEREAAGGDVSTCGGSFTGDGAYLLLPHFQQ